MADAPDGIAIIGADPDSKGNFLQHYFNSRGVARVYKMSMSDRGWTLVRDTPDFSPLDFAQRYTGTFGDEGGSSPDPGRGATTVRSGSTTSI